jgi:hypothetical protein
VLIEVLGGNVESFEREGWSVTEESVDGSVWVGRLTGGGQSALVLAAQSKEAVSTVLDNEKRLILVVYQDGGLIEERTGLTVFDLRAKRVQGTRDGASDIVRKLLEQYGVLFEPRLWAYGFRLHEENY